MEFLIQVFKSKAMIDVHFNGKRNQILKLRGKKSSFD